MTALLFVAFIGFTIWGINSLIKRDVAETKEAKKVNEPALLDAAFDGRQDVTFVVRTGTPKVDAVVQGARERGYRLAHTLDTGTNRYSAESTLIFVREEGAAPVLPVADLNPVAEGGPAHDGPKPRKGMSFGVMSVIGTVLFVAAVVSCSAGMSDSGSGGSKGRPDTPSGLTWGTATVACDRAGASMHPYGFKVSWTMGGISSEVRGNEYHLKAEARVTNASNATAETVVECVVSGTRDNPKVESLHVY